MAAGMDLDAYVRETLLAIVSGVLTAQQDETCGAFIGRSPEYHTAERLKLASDADDNVVSVVQFDLATTVENRRAGDGRGSIKVVPFLEVTGGGKAEAAASTVSRLHFVVPVSIPKPSAQRAEDAERRAKAERALRRGASDSWKSV